MIKCIICDLPIGDGDTIFYLGLDIPYVNIKLHRECFHNIKHNINEFLALNVKKVYNYIEEMNKNKLKSKNTRRK